jgi:hypothetical protein
MLSVRCLEVEKVVEHDRKVQSRRFQPHRPPHLPMLDLVNYFLIIMWINCITSKFSFSGMPTIEEVCISFGLTDVDIHYTDADLENLTTYKLFQQHVRPLLVKENPKVYLLVYNIRTGDTMFYF